jgi:hypothetical protein
VRSVLVPAGAYLVSSNLSDNLTAVRGEGYASSKFLPTTATGSALTLTDTTGSLLPCIIMDMGFEGVGTLQGVGINHIAGSGRAMVERSYIRNFDKGVNRSTGNFQEWYRDVSMASNNYHFYAVSTATAQGGSCIVEGGNYGAMEYAANYINCDTGQSGQFIYKEVFWQGANTGWCFFVKFAQTQSSPSIEVHNCYVEYVYKTGTITIDGVTNIPGFAYLENCGMFRVVNTAPGGFMLVNSNVETNSSDLSFVGAPGMGLTAGSSIDANSTMNHYSARWANGYNIPGFVHSVSLIEAITPAAGTGSWYETNQLQVVAKVPGATTVILNDCSAPFNFTGTATITTTSATDTGIAGLSTCQDLTLPYGGTPFNENSPDSGAGAIAAGTFLAWVWVGKLVSGVAPDMYIWGQLVGGTQLSLLKTVGDNDFTTLKGMNYLTASCAHVALQYGASATCVVRMAGYCVLAFTDRQQAMNFLNSSVFPS